MASSSIKIIKRKKTQKQIEAEEAVFIEFRERKLIDAISNIKHPKPILGYKATLPGAPGWWAKESPGA